MAESAALFDAGAVIRMSPPWSWSVVAIIAVLFAVALLFASSVSVEVTERARGITQPAGGVRPLFAQSDSLVAEVLVRSGDRVAAGTPVARLRSVETDAALVEVEREVERAARERESVFHDSQFERQRAAFSARIESMREQLASLRESSAHRSRRLEAMLELQRAGLLGALQADDAREEAMQAARAVQAASEGASRAEQELAALDAGRERDVRAAERAFQEAVARRDALLLPLRRGLIEAPSDGVIEALLPRAGDYVRSGQLIARLVSQGTTPRVIAFVSEKHRASIRIGDGAAVELDQFPALEFGVLPARVVRVAEDLASQGEITEAMGDGAAIEGAFYRVELEILPSPDAARVRAGMLLDVRLRLRRQRLLDALLEPLTRSGGP